MRWVEAELIVTKNIDRRSEPYPRVKNQLFRDLVFARDDHSATSHVARERLLHSLGSTVLSS